jgi:hypothetical protein
MDEKSIPADSAMLLAKGEMNILLPDLGWDYA